MKLKHAPKTKGAGSINPVNRRKVEHALRRAAELRDAARALDEACGVDHEGRVVRPRRTRWDHIDAVTHDAPHTAAYKRLVEERDDWEDMVIGVIRRAADAEFEKLSRHPPPSTTTEYEAARQVLACWVKVRDELPRRRDDGTLTRTQRLRQKRRRLRLAARGMALVMIQHAEVLGREMVILRSWLHSWR